MGTWSLPVEAKAASARILESAAKKGGHQGLNLVAGGRWSSFWLGIQRRCDVQPGAAGSLSGWSVRSCRPTGASVCGQGSCRLKGTRRFSMVIGAGSATRLAPGGPRPTARHRRVSGLLRVRRYSGPQGAQRHPSGAPAALARWDARHHAQGDARRWTFCPSAGGALVGIEVSGLPWDVAHTMGRYPEHYDDLSDLSGPRWSLTERFVNRSEDVFSSEFYR